jgi:hypothetical protein
MSIRGPMNGDRASVVTSSTGRPSCDSSKSNSARNRSYDFAHGANSTRKSTSLCAWVCPWAAHGIVGPANDADTEHWHAGQLATHSDRPSGTNISLRPLGFATGDRVENRGDMIRPSRHTASEVG